jgi:hypothetical protein
MLVFNNRSNLHSCLNPTLFVSLHKLAPCRLSEGEGTKNRLYREAVKQGTSPSPFFAYFHLLHSVTHAGAKLGEMAVKLSKPLRASANSIGAIDFPGDLLLECRELTLILENLLRVLKLLFELFFSTLAC